MLLDKKIAAVPKDTYNSNMFSDKTFQLTFILSLIAHGVILFQNPNLNFFPANKKTENNTEVSYIKKLEEPKGPPKPAPVIKKEPLLRLPSKTNLLKTTPPPYIDKESVFGKNKEITLEKQNFIKPAFIKPDVIAVKKKITLPPVDLDKINNPAYISYYQIIREKIRRAAYQNYSHTEVGEVYLSFVVSSNGSLSRMRLLEEKSTPSPYLKEISSRSVKEASPFPNFPKELDYPQLSFNVIISFEIE